MLVAGESSGDSHGAKLVAAIREARPDAEFDFFGATSHSMRQAGVSEVVNADNFAIVGIPEIARALPMFLRAFRELRRVAAERRPDVVILIDFPDFNLRLAKSLKKLGLKVVYYISPQIWAWREHRISVIRDNVDLLLTILPFEEEWYANRGFTRVKFVGNPIARAVRAAFDRKEFFTKHEIDEETPLIALLPGSRHKEISRILPPLLETAAILRKRDPRMMFVIPLAPNRNFDEVESALSRLPAIREELDGALLTVAGETYEAVAAADAAAVTSGTATLETAILGTPFAIVYKTSAFNYKLLRPIIRTEHFGLVNLVAGKRIAREMIQDDFTPELLADELERLLEPAIAAEFRRELNVAVERLGPGGASARAAEAILELTSR